MAMSLVLFGQVAVLERLRPATPTPVLNYNVVLVLLRPGVARDSEVGSLLYGHCRHHAGRFSLSG